MRKLIAAALAAALLCAPYLVAFGSSYRLPNSAGLGTYADCGGHAGTAADPCAPGALSPLLGNPTSTLTLINSTSGYSVGQLIANSAAAGSITVPHFSIANTAGGAAIPRLRLNSSDTGTGWQGATVNVDLWLTAPTFTNGDRAAWLPATGSLGHLATFSCVFPAAVWGDGLTAECSPAVGNSALAQLASGTSVYWTLEAESIISAVTASKVFTLIPEIVN